MHVTMFCDMAFHKFNARITTYQNKKGKRYICLYIDTPEDSLTLHSITIENLEKLRDTITEFLKNVENIS